MALVDYFLRIDGVQGESADDKHKGEIDVQSWSWGESHAASPGGGAGGGAGKVQMQDFHFVMRVNKASPRLLLACASGEHLKSALLTCRKAGKAQQEFLTFRFSDVLVSTYQTGGTHEADVVPMDQVSLAYSKIEVEYKEQKADGTLGASVKAGWDLKRNQKI